MLPANQHFKGWEYLLEEAQNFSWSSGVLLANTYNSSEEDSYSLFGIKKHLSPDLNTAPELSRTLALEPIIAR